jgi:16S rRNA processing protein RimM
MQLGVGRILRPHGLHGEVAVEVRTDDPDLRFAADAVLATEPAANGPLTVVTARWHTGRLLVRFAGYDDRTAAQQLSGTMLVLDSATVARPEDPDSYPDYELIGLRVSTVAGEPVGVVADILHQGQDLLVIKPAAGRPGREEILVPFVLPLVPEVDVERGRLVIDPPPGLLDPDAAI